MSVEVTRIRDGMYRVVRDGRSETVFTVAVGGDRWAFWNGCLFIVRTDSDARTRKTRAGGEAHQSLSAPMPATVLKVLVVPGATVRKGDTLMILEAMKM